MHGEVNVSKLKAGYIYDKKFEYKENERIYKIEANDYIAIGSAVSGSIWEMITVQAEGGIFYNVEFAQKEKDKNKYSGAVAYTRQITDEQLDKILKYCEENNWYNLYTHNCSAVASGAWEIAFGETDGFKAKRTIFETATKDVHCLVYTPEVLKENILRKSNAMTEYEKVLVDIIENWQ